MENSKILIRNAAQIVTCHGDKARRGAEMSDLGVIEDGAVAMSDGVITHVGPTEEVLRNIHAEDYLEIRAENQAVLPGFVDSHTHFIFGGYREEEFSWRLRGDSYMSIMERGGGIVNTMKATRESDFDTLWDRGEERLDELFSMGVTTVEGKSGYGLDLQTELVQLRVMSHLNESHPMDVVSTFLGAHAVPPEFDDIVPVFVSSALSSSIIPTESLLLAAIIPAFDDTEAVIPSAFMYNPNAPSAFTVTFPVLTRFVSLKYPPIPFALAFIMIFPVLFISATFAAYIPIVS